MFGYLMPNYILEEEYKSIGKEYIEKLERNNKEIASNNSKKVSIGIYVDNDEWYTNIYNTISTVVFIQNAVLNYNLLNDRFLEFIKIHKIDSNPSIFTYASIERTIKEFLKNDIILDLKFSLIFSLFLNIFSIISLFISGLSSAFTTIVLFR